VDGQAARHGGELLTFRAPGRKIAVDEPRHSARKGCEVGILAAPGLLMVPSEVATINHARDFQQAEITLATDLGEFRGLHPRDAVFGLWRARHVTIMPLFCLLNGIPCTFRRDGGRTAEAESL
jgi:hypothetical protein